jgi:ubiquinone/menaquinone biosynthesis C-methylase UbiE
MRRQSAVAWYDARLSPSFRGERMAKSWDLDLVFDETYLEFYRDLLTPERTRAECDRIVRLLGPPPGGRLADLCCGHGRHARELARRGFEVVGVDRSPGFLRVARDGCPTGAHFARGDVAALPLADRSVDGVYCWFSSVGYARPGKDLVLLREARRVLRPGGKVAVETRNWATLESGDHVLETSAGRIVDRVEVEEAGARLRTRRRYEPVDGPEREVEFSLHRYDVASFAGMLKAAGFADVRALGGDDETSAKLSPRVVFVGRRPDGAP